MNRSQKQEEKKFRLTRTKLQHMRNKITSTSHSTKITSKNKIIMEIILQSKWDKFSE